MREIPGRAAQATGSSDLARFFVLFSIGLAIGLFAVAVKMTRSGDAFSSPKEVQVAKPATVSKSGKKPRSQAKKRADTPSAQARTEGNERSGRRTVVPSSATAEEDASTMNVKDDSTPVFQSNSAGSAVVKSLKKGDEVKSGGLQIIDSNGTWTLIQKSGRSGFVPSEMLERKSPTKQAQQ